MSLFTYLLSFVERWLGAFPRVMLAFVGILICIFIVGAFWDRRIRKTGGFIGLLVGLSMAFHVVILNYFSNINTVSRFRFSITVIAFALLIATVRAVKNRSLRLKHGLLWIVSASALLLVVVFPHVIESLRHGFGVSYLEIASGAGLVFLALICFQLSVSLRDIRNKRNRDKQCCRSGEDGFVAAEGSNIDHLQWTSRGDQKSSILRDDTHCRTIRGTHIGGPLIIILAVLSVFIVGMSAQQPMVGDEVTHFYMMQTQSHNLSQPNFFAEIPLASGEIETRRYPHSFLWHYGGAVLYRLTGGAFWVIQLYQTLFLLQFLVVAYLLAKSRRGVETRSALLYTLVLGSLPLTLIFSVAFYQDMPMTAQVLTSFFLLKKRHWLAATFFLILAIGIKITAILFLPVFFTLLFMWGLKRSGWKSGFLTVCCSMIIIFCSLWSLGKAINIYGEAAFYPQKQLESLIDKVKCTAQEYLSASPTVANGEMRATVTGQRETLPLKARSVENAPQVIANHPGDLRLKENFLVYGGILMWLLLVLWCGSRLLALRWEKHWLSPGEAGGWLFAVGGGYMILAAYLLKTSPDARFFLPGLVFLLLPVVEGVVKLPKPKLVISLLAALAIFQAGYVLAKAYKLREVPQGIHEAIAYLEKTPPCPSWIFMYPEGNYRLFPVRHNWYFQNRLKEFWRAKNDQRIKMLHQYKIGAIVIKKALIFRADNNYTNLGIYPVSFVNDISADVRFEKVFSNQDVLIYSVPQE